MFDNLKYSQIGAWIDCHDLLKRELMFIGQEKFNKKKIYDNFFHSCIIILKRERNLNRYWWIVVITPWFQIVVIMAWFQNYYDYGLICAIRDYLFSWFHVIMYSLYYHTYICIFVQIGTKSIIENNIKKSSLHFLLSFRHTLATLSLLLPLIYNSGMVTEHLVLIQARKNKQILN